MGVGVLRGSAAGASAPTTHSNTPPTSSPAAQAAAKPLPRRGQDARSPQIPRWAFPRSARFKSHLVTSPHLGPRPAASISAAAVRHRGNLRTPPPPPPPPPEPSRRPSCGSRAASPLQRAQMCRRPQARSPRPQLQAGDGNNKRQLSEHLFSEDSGLIVMI